MVDAVFFMSCYDSSDDDPVDDYTGATAFTVEVPSPATTVLYFSFAAGLEAGDEITSGGINSTGWDIAFTNGRLIYTNSGDTATAVSSGGVGGVWFTGQTLFQNTDDFVTGPYYATDKTYSVNASATAESPSGQGMPTSKSRLNVMTYMGYGFGNGRGDGDNDNSDGDSGAEDTPLGDFKYNAMGFYKSGAEMGSYIMTNRVYVIKHGDGAGYTKIQITSMEAPEGTTGPRVYSGHYKTF
jgi:hypothetical protein